MATLLTMVQTACRRLGLTVPNVVATSSDQQAIQIMSLLNGLGQTLIDDADWPKLRTLKTITTVSGTSDYDYPADYHRMIDGTFWDRTNNWEVLGPDTPIVDRWRRESTIGQVGIRRYFTNIGTGVRIYPPVTVSGDTLVYEYISANWAETTGGTGIAEMTADSDEPRLDAEMMILGTIALWLDAKGLDSTNAMARYLARKESRKAIEMGGGTINMEPVPRDPFLDIVNIPDSGYNLG